MSARLERPRSGEGRPGPPGPLSGCRDCCPATV